MMETVTASEISLLQKLLDLQRSDGAVRDAIETARRIAEAVEGSERACRTTARGREPADG